MLRRIVTLGAIAAMCLGMIAGMATSQVSAAQGTPVEGTPCAANTNDEIRTFITNFNDAFDQGDVDALAQMISPEIVRDSPRGDDMGSEDAIASFTSFFEAYPDLTSQIDLIVVDAPLAVLHYTATGTQATTFAGTEPTGEPSTWAGMYMLVFECGKVVHMYSEVDQLSQRNQGNSAPATPISEAGAASPASCPELTDEAATSLMDTWYHDMWTGNLDVLATITTPDIYHHWATTSDSSGQAEQLERLQATLDFMGGATSDYDAIAVDGDYIAVHWVQSLGDDTWGGLNIFHTECGLIDEVWSEMDLADLPGMDMEATPAG